MFKFANKINFDLKNLEDNILQESLQFMEKQINIHINKTKLSTKGIKVKAVKNKFKVYAKSKIEHIDQVILYGIVKKIINNYN